MQVRRFDDVEAFERAAGALLLVDPARNNLPLGILTVLRTQPEVYPAYHLWLALENGMPVGLALQTPPHNLVVGEPLDGEAVDALADALADDAIVSLPGVVGNVPWADRFVERWRSRTGQTPRHVMDQGVFSLTEVVEVPTSSGVPRPASGADHDHILSWLEAFGDEALPPEHPRDDQSLRHTLKLRLAGEGGGFWLWEDEGKPVSLTGHHTAGGIGSRIGPVYTPPKLRGRGYATGLVAAVSAWRLGAGDAACFLYTDLSNPTSNAIYRRIGYEMACRSVEYAFDRP
jgi:uncharacterized protein